MTLSFDKYTVSGKKEPVGFPYAFGTCKDIFTLFAKQITQNMSKMNILYLEKSTFLFLRQKITKRIAATFEKRLVNFTN